MKAAAIAVAAVLLLGCKSSEPTESTAFTDIATMLANPSAYDGAWVHVQGAAVVRFEASFICPTPETLDSPGSSKKCLSLVPGESNGMAYDIRQLDGKTVEIIGSFNAESFGHMGAYGGTIAATWGRITGTHSMDEAPPPPSPPGSSAALIPAFPAASGPQIPIASGQYVFQHRFAEHPTIPSIPLDVTISGSHIVVVNPAASDPFPAGVLAEGELMWHAASKQWIIGHKASDRSVEDAGGCSEGPEVVDLANRIYWTC